METKFQTSFIPKKPLTQASTSSSSERSGGTTSILLLIGVFIFAVSALAAGGVYGYQVFLTSKQNDYAQSLKSLQSNINVQQIATMKIMANKIDLAQKVLDSHVAVSQVFDIISKLTASNIRFTALDLQVQTDKTKTVKISLDGYAPSYDALAFQGDQLGHLENLDLRNVISNPVIQNPIQNQNSTVSFTMTANISPDSLLYKNIILAGSQSTAGSNAVGTTSNTQ